MKAFPRRRGLTLLATAVAFAIAGLAATPAARAGAVSPPSFGTPVTLPSSTGGEPSIAIDTNAASSGLGDMYVVSPNATSTGPAEWHSYNGGTTWANPVPIDTTGPAPGGDTDVAVQQNGNVLVTDLDVTHALVQLSTDHGQTFNTGFPTAYEDDRPWLTTSGTSTVYVAYHDFVGEVPVVCTSTDGGNTFTSCVPTFGPNPLAASNCAENTVPARAFIVDPTDGSLNFMFSCSTAPENLAHPPYGPLHDYYLARSTDGGMTYSISNIFSASTTGKAPNYANIFGSLAEDSSGDYYALFDGTADDSHVLTNPFHVYLMWTSNKGLTWNGPYQVDQEAGGTKVLAHLAVTSTGNVDVVWYGAANTGEPNGQCGSTGMVTNCTDGTTNVGMDPGGPVQGNWQVYMAQSHNALSTSPTWTEGLVDPNYRHFGEICTNGIVCGSSDRHLLDFISVAVDCTGKAHVTYGADQNSPTIATGGARADGALTTVVTNQAGGAALDPPSACTPTVTAPEVPLAAMLPLGAVFAGGVAAVVRRRQRRAVAV